jgi:hypothetical protein
VITDLDPAVGLDYLAAWTDEVIVAVTAGRSGAELVRTTGELVRAAGLRLRAAVLLRRARDDVSFADMSREAGAQEPSATEAPARSGNASAGGAAVW